MTDEPEGYAAARDAAAWTRLDAGVIRLGGDDAFDFIDRNVTADLTEEPTQALLLNPEGKTRDSLTVFPQDEDILAVSCRPEETAEEWRSNVFVEDVTVEVTGTSVVSVQGPEAEGVVEQLEAPVYEEQRTPSGGYDVLGDVKPDVPSYDGYGDVLRVEAGVAGFENELSGRVPVGSRLDLFSQQKCYVGQEVVARIRQRGGGPSRLLFSLDGVPETAEPGDVVELEGSPAGELTTVAESPRHGHVALGYVEADAAGRDVTVSGGEATVHEPPLVREDEG